MLSLSPQLCRAKVRYSIRKRARCAKTRDATSSISLRMLAYLTGIWLLAGTGTAVTLFCGLPSINLSE